MMLMMIDYTLGEAILIGWVTGTALSLQINSEWFNLGKIIIINKSTHVNYESETIYCFCKPPWESEVK